MGNIRIPGHSSWLNITETSSEQQFWGRKRFVDEGGPWRMARLLQVDKKVTVTKIITLCNHSIMNRKASQNALYVQP